MALHTQMVGQAGDAVTDRIEDRWTMNYAASVNDENPSYYANEGGATVPTHPTYVSHLEWDAIGELYAKLPQLNIEERLRGVHSYNQTAITGTFGAGDELTCVATVVGVEQRHSGGRLTIKTETTCGDRPIATSFTSSVFRGVAVEGGDDVVPVTPKADAPAPNGSPSRVDDIVFGTLAPYHFSECARDYGEIHTDRNTAQKAGLPGLIMHGTGTIAYVVSNITNHEADGDASKVTHFEAKLGGMVLCPSKTHLQVFHDDADRQLIRFELVDEEGVKAISGGVVRLSDH